MMRIVIDMQGAQNESRYRGIGRYTLDFVVHFIIEAQKQGIEIIAALNGVFSDSIEPLRAQLGNYLSQDAIRVWESLSPVQHLDPNNNARRQSAELIREAFLLGFEPDMVLVTDLFAGAGDDSVTSINERSSDIPTAAILYDLIPLAYRQDYLSADIVRDMYLNKLEYLQKANLLLAISSFTKDEALKYLKNPEHCIINISNASAIVGGDEVKNTELLKKLNIAHPFLLYCGGADFRKNLARLIEAYQLIPAKTRAKSQLVLAGKMPINEVETLRAIVKDQGLSEEDVIFTGYVDDEDLHDLYRCARGFVFPSYCEGFGLPALEAMMFDLPVIGSNVSSIPEVIGNPDAMFDPFSTADMSRLMTRLLDDEAYRHALIEHGKQQRNHFSWDKTASIALEAMIAYSENHKHQKTTISPQNFEKELIYQVADLMGATSHEDMLQASLALDYALPRAQHKRYLYVDISELHERDSKSGIQRVVRSVLKNLLKHPLNDYVVKPVYATMTAQYRVANRWLAQYNNEPRQDVTDDVLDARSGDVFLGLDLQHFVTIQNEAYLTKLRQRGVRVSFVVYDLLPILMPHVFHSNMSDAHSRWLSTLAKFDDIIAISRAVADEAKQWLNEQPIERMRPLSIDWFHLGADIDDSEPSRGLPTNAPHVLATLAQRPTFLMVGTVEPRKGQAQTLAAFEKLWADNQNVNLVIVGKEGWHVETLIKKIHTHPELNQRLFWLDGVSDEYLEKVYAASTCLIAASEGEGFGLPLIEAAQHKLPIIARDIPVFKEVAGEYAFYFEGLNSVDLSNAVQAWLKLHQQGIAPQSSQMPWLTWKESAEQLLSIVCKDSTLKPQQNG